MSLAPDTRLGPYQIVAKIGEGGMGEVYRAEDVRLKRTVALKVLPAEFAADPERLSRFEQEAQAAAALNHPHIAAIFDVGFDQASDTRYIVHEFLEGQTLRERLGAGPLRLQEAVEIARQIADALSAAHAAGIVHRDLKPENLFLTGGGPVKVLDFGLAKLVEMTPAGPVDPSNSPTIIGTTIGQVLGTVGYMAPEQAQGQEVDRRADIFAFGCVLHEMLTGARAFEGRTVHQTLDLILSEEPALPEEGHGTLPPQLEWIRGKCLEKEPARRYQSADDLRVDVTRVADGLRSGRGGRAEPEASGPAVSSTGLSVGQVLRSPVGLGLMVLAAAAVIAASLPETPDARDPAPVPAQITRFSTRASEPVVSPSGQMLAFIAAEPDGIDSQIWIKSLPDGPPQQLTRTPGQKQMPAFSPDGSRIAYTAIGDNFQWDTWVVPIVGGEPRLMLRDANSLSWTPGGGLIFSEFKQGAQLAIVTSDESGADRRDLWVPALTQMAHQSDVSPDGQSVVVGYMGLGPLSPDSQACFVRPLAEEGADTERVVGGGQVGCLMFARWSPDGAWIYFLSDSRELWREPAVGGPAERLVGARDLGLTVSSFSLFPDGASLIFAAGQSQSGLWLRDPDGLATQLTVNGEVYDPEFSPDGEAVYYVAARRGGAGAVWRYRVADQRRERVCPGMEASELSVSADGRQLLLVVESDGRAPQQVQVCTIDGGEPPRAVLDGEVSERDPLYSPDGSTIYLVVGEGRGGVVWRVGVDGRDARPLTQEMPDVGLRAVSPDGAWLSVEIEASSPRETWLYPTTGDGEARRLVSGWGFRWIPGNCAFLFDQVSMVSTTWLLENPDGALLPTDLPEFPDAAWFESVGARRVSTGQPFRVPSVSPTSLESVEGRIDYSGNLYRLELPQ